ncbi:MAG: D-2-hydroxyacid dehydrogenase [Lachnospiraceae bacterium]|nr:D-2-hydroxyacid dehydrogenase [Lachnospiraceae bacterium]
MKLLVTGSLGATEKDLEALAALGHEIVLHPDERVPVEDPERFDGAVCNSLFHYTTHEGFTNLRYLQITSAGYDRVPMDWVRARGITVHNANGVYSPAMAEWTIMRILELLKHVPQGFRNQLAARHKKDWKWQELTGKNVLLAGFGAYGREIAKRLKPFGARLTVVNRSLKEDANVDEFCTLDKFPELLPQADILILALAHSPQTHHILDDAALQSMKPGSYLINAARGGLIDEPALLRALQEGPLAGAALDVYETEPLAPESPLWTLENVLLSPHNSFVGDHDHERMMQVVIGNLKAFQGQ